MAKATRRPRLARLLNRKGPQRLRQFFKPTRPSDSVKDILLRQVEVAREGLEVAHEMMSRDASPTESRRTMRSIEHEGDDARIDLTERVNTALTVPLEREDLIRASRALDDITDNLRDMVREFDKWGVQPGEWSKDVLRPGQRALDALRDAIKVTGEEKSRDNALVARSHGSRIRRKYQDGMTLVLKEDLSIETVKRIEILKRVDDVGILFTVASDALIDGLVKRYL